MSVRLTFPCVAASLAAVIVLSVSTFAVEGDKKRAAEGEKKRAAEGASAFSPEAMEKWMKAATPGKEHKELARMAGRWNTVSKFWMAGPASPPTETKGTSSLKMILGGRVLHQTAQGEMFGMKFEGIGLTGYDNAKKKYVSIWADTTATAIFYSEGTRDDKTNTITFIGKMDDPATGEVNKKVQMVWRLDNKDRQTMEFYDGSGQKAKKMGEIVYERASKKSKTKGAATGKQSR
jgi:hypothetical protein